jgi:16S rRNA G527 N7-methylase RsmG
MTTSKPTVVLNTIANNINEKEIQKLQKLVDDLKNVNKTTNFIKNEETLMVMDENK